MTTPFASYAFPATGAPTPRTLPVRLSDIKNVRDFGAVGDGVLVEVPAHRLVELQRVLPRPGHHHRLGPPTDPVALQDRIDCQQDEC